MAVSTIDPNGLNVGQLGGTRNRIINSAMLIDQRNSGGTWNAINGGYGLDRWKVNSFNGGAATGIFSVQRSTTAPDGFSNSLLVTSLASTADSANNIFNVEQKIEGYNTFDLAFGTSSAKTITLSFWVRSSLTGTFGGAIKNSARNRAYPFTYTISSANTFEYKTITIAGDTSGTWVGASTSTGVWVSFGLGVGSSRSGTAGAWNSSDDFSATGATSVVGTSGATWYLTGVMLETGDVATPHENRSYGEELRACQRYYYKTVSSSGSNVLNNSWNTSNGIGTFNKHNQIYDFCDIFPIEMRASPSTTFFAQSGSGYLRIEIPGVANKEISISPNSTNSSNTGMQLRYVVNETDRTEWNNGSGNAFGRVGYAADAEL